MANISWQYCQENSDLILSSGLSLLRNQEGSPFGRSLVDEYGNYLISDQSNNWKYIGETKSLKKRIKQHSGRTSTFYKNYLRKQSQFPDLPQGLQLNDFVVKFILSKIGRKELEEFGIVNIPANLNKFQKGKRNLFKTSVAQEPWHIIQNCAKEILTDGEKHLAESALHSWFDADVPSAAGLYSVSNEGIGLIYIGESSDIFERYRTHSRDTYFSALRRHIGEDILGFKLQVRKGKRRYFSDDENLAVTDYLKTCSISFMPIQFGRFEFEEYLIRKYRPFLNRKENR